jgi:3,4-dihydroxy 2-butanone 4-phosphate synthase/GTP cyclohydrolase II
MAVTTPFATIADAIEDIREGRFVVVVDDPDRENEGDLVIAAQFATPETINFMATHGRGLICLCLTEERADRVGLRLMTERNEAPLGTAFTITFEAREGVTTARTRSRSRSHPTRRPPTSSRPDTCTDSVRSRVACSNASAKPKPQSTSRVSRG